MPNVANLIYKSNTEKLRNKQRIEFPKCNCINKTTCPLKGKCQYECIIYKIALYGELSTGHHDRGAPKKHLKDSLKKTLSTSRIDQWSTLAADHQASCRTVHQIVSTFEDTRRAYLREKRRRRKIQGGSAAIPNQAFNCRRCSWTCLSCIGLVSNQHVYSRHGQPPS